MKTSGFREIMKREFKKHESYHDYEARWRYIDHGYGGEEYIPARREYYFYYTIEGSSKRFISAKEAREYAKKMGWKLQRCKLA